MTRTSVLIAGVACACLGAPAHATVYKCVTDDGHIEYSTIPCGPQERPTEFNEDATFSGYSRYGSGYSAPVSDYDKRRQKDITERARGGE
jgi:hypothetical protein